MSSCSPEDGTGGPGFTEDLQLGSSLSRIPHVTPPLPASLSVRESFRSQQVALEMQNRELREAQHALERARTRYFELFDSAPIAYFVFDERHHLEELNVAAGELLGGDRTRWKHRPFFPLLLESDRQRFHQHLTSVMRNHGSEELELTLQRSDGSAQRVRLTSQLILPEPGERPVCLSAGVVLPVQRIGAPASSTREALWGRHLNHAAIPAAVAVIQGGWVFTNPAFRSLVDYSETELQGLTWIALTYPEDRDQEVASYNRLLAGEADSYQIEKRLLRKDGSTVRVEATVSCTRNPEGRLELLFLTARQATDVATSPQAIPALGRSEGIASEANDGWGQFDLNQVLSTGLPRNLDPKEPCRVQWKLASQLPMVRLHPRQVLNAVDQLLRNAREALGQGSGRILVTTGRQCVEPDLWQQRLLGATGCSGECVFLEISDEGSGMDAEVQSRALEPYFTTKPGHAGLGLTSVAAVAHQHQGGLRITSQTGRGTTVKLFFPLGASVEDSALATVCPSLDEEPATTAHEAGVRPRVLLVDDEDEVRFITARMIEALGLDVDESNGAAQALAMFQQEPSRYAVVITDITMPGGGGIHLLHQVKSQRADLPFVLMSGLSDAGVAELHLNGSSTGGHPPFLQKPFSLHRLQEVLEEVQSPPLAR